MLRRKHVSSGETKENSSGKRRKKKHQKQKKIQLNVIFSFFINSSSPRKDL
jgi:hypothetical protein